MSVQIGEGVQELLVVSDEWQHRVRSIDIITGSGFQPMFSRRCRIVGWSVRETTGAAVAGFDLMNGQAISDDAPVTVNLAAGASSFAWVGHPGPLFSGGLGFNPRVGNMAGAIWVEDAGL